MRSNMVNNNPQWAPSRALIVSDPSKLSYFARANMVRSGLNAGPAAASAGAFSGVRLLNSTEDINPATGGTNPAASGTSIDQGGQSVSDFLDRLSRGVGSFFSAATPPVAAPVMPPVEAGPLGLPLGAWIVGGLLAVGVGYAVLKR